MLKLARWRRSGAQQTTAVPQPCWWSPLPLTELPAGRTAEVVEIVSARASRLTHLSTYGLVPGSLLILQQRHPAYVVQVGETEVTLDAEVARDIMVRAIWPGHHPE